MAFVGARRASLVVFVVVVDVVVARPQEGREVTAVVVGGVHEEAPPQLEDDGALVGCLEVKAKGSVVAVGIVGGKGFCRNDSGVEPELPATDFFTLPSMFVPQCLQDKLLFSKAAGGAVGSLPSASSLAGAALLMCVSLSSFIAGGCAAITLHMLLSLRSQLSLESMDSSLCRVAMLGGDATPPSFSSESDASPACRGRKDPSRRSSCFCLLKSS